MSLKLSSLQFKFFLSGRHKYTRTSLSEMACAIGFNSKLSPDQQKVVSRSWDRSTWEPTGYGIKSTKLTLNLLNWYSKKPCKKSLAKRDNLFRKSFFEKKNQKVTI